METLNRNLSLIASAMSFQAETSHTLEIAHGRAWVTLGGQLGQANPDIFLTEGQALQVAAAQHVVVEPWPRYPGDELTVHWTEIQN